MISLPERTKIPKKQVVYEPHKRGNSTFFERLSLSTKDKQDLRRQIARLTITHTIDTRTTNIPAGTTVQQLVVMRVELLTDKLDKELLAQFDMRVKFYPIFVLVYPDAREELLVHYKEGLSHEIDGRVFKILKTFASSDDVSLYFEGNNLDEVYDNLVKDVGQSELIAPNVDNLKEAIDKTEQLAKLEKEANSLKKKMFQEKSTKKAMELRKAYKTLLTQIKEIKGE
ncbi:DUF4391 domain-containing protein [Streptococcus pneumoniae]